MLSVQELNGAAELRRRVQPRAGRAGRRCSRRCRRAASSPLPNGVFARALPAKQRPPTRRRLQRHGAAPADRHDVGRGGIRRQPRRQRVRGRRPGHQRQPGPTLDRLPATAVLRRATCRHFRFGGAFGWTQGIDYFCNCATNCVRLAADEVHQAVLAGLLGEGELHAAARDAGQRRLLRD